MTTDKDQKPSDNAVNFEAVKVSMSQSKDGVTLRLIIHPHECPPSLHTDWVGSRYMIAMVKLADDDTVVKNPTAEEGRKAVAQCGTMCRNERFQRWLVHMNIADGDGEEAAAEGLKGFLLISSRSELAKDASARKKWSDLVRAFELDVEGGRI